MTAPAHPSELVAPMDYAALAPPSLTTPVCVAAMPGARSYLNIPYATMIGWRPLLLDLHLPAGGTGPFPVVVYAHGGSFVGGIKAMGPWHDLPAHGIAVASVGYRLSGEVHFPEPVEDIRAAVRWIRVNAGHYDLDATRVSGWGSSAGGYLITMAGLAGDSPLGRPVGDPAAASSRLSAVIDHYGVADPTRLGQDAFDNTEAEVRAIEAIARQFLGFDPAEEPARAAAADPLALADRVTDPPPFLILHGDDDHRVGLAQSRRLHDGLTARGHDARLVVVPGADHAAPDFTTPERLTEAVEFLHHTWNRSRPASRAR
ncbi:alpha/beta hydrolase [Streptomyces cuspidosporus]|uniref:Alpha/beta hydrolase n=1 Tax=Streptomyces cuspidosporus TaxID=66882 RepID=A0ABN3FJM2_9ACTN